VTDHTGHSLRLDETFARVRAHRTWDAFESEFTTDATSDRVLDLARIATDAWYAYGMAVQARNAHLRTTIAV
jgi:hypothetical protein